MIATILASAPAGAAMASTPLSRFLPYLYLLSLLDTTWFGA